MGLDEALTLALRHHQAGDWPRAEAIYHEILAADPAHAGALHLLGVLTYQAGRADQAVAYIRRAIDRNPAVADYHSNLGLAYQSLGDWPAAVGSYREAIRLLPGCAEAHNNLGMALQVQGDLAGAAASYRQAIAFQPEYPEAHNNLGVALQRLGRLAEAVACYDEALRQRPDYPDARRNRQLALDEGHRREQEQTAFRESTRQRPDDPVAHYNLGVVLQEQGKVEEARACYRQALALRPDFAEAYYNLAVVAQEQGQLPEAIAHYEQAVRCRPDYPEAFNNRGAALQRQGRLPEAVASYRRALARRAAYPEALNNLGVALYESGRAEEALANLEAALRLQGDYAEAHTNRALVWLQQGDYRRGWAEYEWRWRRRAAVPRHFPQPLWDGSDLAGRPILLWAEQGLGDTIQFVRYAALVRQRGGRVILECQPPLRRLLAGCRGIGALVVQGDPLPEFACHAPLLSLPHLLGTTLETVPCDVPYLAIGPESIAHWGQELAAVRGFKVGIAWQGNPDLSNDWQRSVPLRQFAPLAQVRGVRLVRLQKGPGSEQLAEIRNLFPVVDLDGTQQDRRPDFADTAALVRNLDLVVTCDSAVAHLAGALGVPVWVLLPPGSDWRWLRQRDDCPWYPTARLFRQKSSREWEPVIRQAASELARLV